jgi:6,7-dimethyl-8-ribityllumazine synthase
MGIEASMGKTVQGALDGAGLRIGIIAGRFNEFITARLIEGALDGLTRHGVKEEDIVVVRVPGAFEIPSVAARLVEDPALDALICLGAVIRGETPHFEYVAAEVSKGIAQVGLRGRIPVIYGVLTTDSVEQAIDRAGAKAGNKGFAAAEAAIEMVNLLRQL